MSTSHLTIQFVQRRILASHLIFLFCPGSQSFLTTARIDFPRTFPQLSSTQHGRQVSSPPPSPLSHPCSLWHSLLTSSLHKSIFICSARRHLSTRSCSPWQTPAHHSVSSSTASSGRLPRCLLQIPSSPPSPHREPALNCPPARLLPELSLFHRSGSSWRMALGIFIFRCPVVFGTKQILNKRLRRNKQKNEEL